MSVACQQSYSIVVAPSVITCAQFDSATVNAVNAHFGTTWNGQITGTYDFINGLTFDCPQFLIGITHFLAYFDKTRPLFPNVNPAVALPVNPPSPFITYTWQGWVAGNAMFDTGAPQNPVLTPC